MSAALARPMASNGLAGPQGYRAVSQRFLVTALAIAASTHVVTIGSMRLYALLTAGNSETADRGIRVITHDFVQYPFHAGATRRRIVVEL